MPRKSSKIIEKRRDYVKQKLAKSKSISKDVKELSNKLFISERQVWRDWTN